MDGLIGVDKPAGWTSHDVVARLRRVLMVRKAGHGGTLDPGATGVLLVGVGRATRFFPYLPGRPKVYRGTLRLGFATDTYDASGRPAEPVRPVGAIGPEGLAAAMAAFEGRILQTPPAFSAKKIEGRPAHRLARAGREVVLAPVEVVVDAFRLLDYHPPEAAFEVRCGPGTYVRSLAHDLGAALGCGAHLVSLVRTAVGTYRLEDCRPVERIEALAAEGRTAEFLVPLERLLPETPRFELSPEDARRVLDGRTVPTSGAAGERLEPGMLARLVDGEGRLLALARVDLEGTGLRPCLVLGPDRT
jgi:tRNA pseudouridine55 synthase